MSNKLVSNISFYTLGNMLPKAASFILLPIYTSYLNPSEYGIIGAMTALSAFLGVFLTLSFERSIFRLLYDFEENQSQKKFLGTIFIGVFTFATLVVLALFLSKNFVSKFYDSIDFYPYFMITILTVYLNFFGNIPIIFLQVKQKAKTYVVVGLVQFFLTNCSVLYFVVYLHMKADGYLLGGLLSAALMLPYFLWFTRRIVTFTFDIDVFKAVSKFSLPIFPAVISHQVVDLSDRIFIQRCLNTSDLGLYSLAATIAGVVLVFTTAFKNAYDPYFYEIANTLKVNDAREVLKKTNNLYYLVTLLISFTIALVSEEVIELFLDARYSTASRIVPIICIAYFISKVSGLINLSFYQNKKTKLMMYISIASGVLNVVLNFLLIPSYGYFGAGYATVISYVFMLLVKYYFSKNEFFIEIDFPRLLIVSTLFCALYFLTNWLDFSLIISLTLKTAILILVSFFLYLTEKKNFKVLKAYI